MNARLARRQAALAAVALVGALGAIALSRIGGSGVRTSSSIASWSVACAGTIPQ